MTTEKDAVRFPRLTKVQVPIYFLRVEIEILSGHESWEHCVAPHLQAATDARRRKDFSHDARAVILSVSEGSHEIRNREVPRFARNDQPSKVADTIRSCTMS